MNTYELESKIRELCRLQSLIDEAQAETEAIATRFERRPVHGV